MLAPNRTKFRKQQRGRMTGTAWSGCNVEFGDYAMIALEAFRLASHKLPITTRVIRRGEVL